MPLKTENLFAAFNTCFTEIGGEDYHVLKLDSGEVCERAFKKLWDFH